MQKQINQPYFQSQNFLSLKCGLHAINNLIGKQAFTNDSFKDICKQLEQQSNQSYQHRIFGGDYDVSVLIRALQKYQYQVQWHDTRKPFTTQILKQDSSKQLKGYLVNIKISQSIFQKIFRTSGRHWVSIKLCNNQKGQKIYKLDSNQKSATQMNENKLIQFLDKQRTNGGQILKVFSFKKTQK